MDILSKILSNTQILRKQPSKVNDATLKIVSKGHKVNHTRHHCFGLMTIEEDQRFEFDIGIGIAKEINELHYLVGEFKKIP